MDCALFLEKSPQLVDNVTTSAIVTIVGIPIYIIGLSLVLVCSYGSYRRNGPDSQEGKMCAYVAVITFISFSAIILPMIFGTSLNTLTRLNYYNGLLAHCNITSIT